MNSNFRPPNDPGALAERLCNELSKYLGVVATAEYIATNPTMQEITNRIEELKQKSNASTLNPFGLPKEKRRWVTEKLVITKKGVYKDYKEAS
jgi:hypothetical protein